ncbi:hypothetical protein SynSYN20_01295 [Synechococcus sp. SYN20]|nr:hypothetical protein [Synechococcus sp. SYN20]QNJ25629.1 hypothetical protein SynSYN20_01295 [Synechococcus sp. SYN20]
MSSSIRPSQWHDFFYLQQQQPFLLFSTLRRAEALLARYRQRAY